MQSNSFFLNKKKSYPLINSKANEAGETTHSCMQLNLIESGLKGEGELTRRWEQR